MSAGSGSGSREPSGPVAVRVARVAEVHQAEVRVAGEEGGGLNAALGVPEPGVKDRVGVRVRGEQLPEPLAVPRPEALAPEHAAEAPRHDAPHDQAARVVEPDEVRRPPPDRPGDREVVPVDDPARRGRRLLHAGLEVRPPGPARAVMQRVELHVGRAEHPGDVGGERGLPGAGAADDGDAGAVRRVSRRSVRPARRRAQESTLRIAWKAACGMSTLPTAFMRRLPSFCFWRSLRFRLMSPP